MRSLLTIRATFNTTQVVFAIALLILTNVDTKSELVEKLREQNNCVGGAAQRKMWTHIYASISLFVCSLSFCLLGAMFYYGGLGTPVGYLILNNDKKSNHQWSTLEKNHIVYYFTRSFNPNIFSGLHRPTPVLESHSDNFAISMHLS